MVLSRDRQQRRHLALAVAAVALLGVAAVGCSDDDDGETSTGTAAGATAPSAVDGTTVDGTTYAVVFLVDGGECDETVAVERTATGDVTLEAAMAELLAGPTAAEQADGAGGWFSADTAGLVVSAEVADGVGTVDLDATLPDVIPNASSSCGSTGLLAQLDGTALGVPGVDEVVYSLDGDVDAFYAWLQLGPPTTG